MKHFWVGFLLAIGSAACSSVPESQQHTSIRIRWTRDPENLSPLVQPNQNALDALTLLHCSLLQLNFSTGTYSPALADSLPRVRLLGDSLTELSYELRRAAAWDNGQPVLASDVAFTLKLLQCPGLPNEKLRAQYGFIHAIRLDAANARRFTLICRGQAPEYSYESGDFPILPEAVLDSGRTLRPYSLAKLRLAALRQVKPDAALQALAARYQRADPSHHPERLPGCGAYRMTNWEIDHSLTFTRKTHWWADTLQLAPLVLQARPLKLQFLIIPSEATAALALRRHELDVLPQLSAREFRQLRTADATRAALAFYTTASYEMVTAGFNTSRPILHDSLTRQALSRLFDPVRLMQATQLGQGLRTVGLVHPHDRRYYNDSLPLPAYNPQQALDLLRRAGWQRQPTGWVRTRPARQPEHLALAVRYRAGDSTFETIALQFKAAASALHIPVELLPTESSLLTEVLREGNFDIYVRKLNGNPFAFNFAPLLHSRTIRENNFTKFGTRATDQLLDAITAAGSATQKRRLVRRFQVMMQQQMPILPLFFLPYRLVTAQGIKGLYPSGLKPGYTAATATWVASPATPATAH